MRLSSSVCNETFAWVGDIYVPPGTRIQPTEETLARVAEVEAAGEDITIDVYPDLQLVISPENIINWGIVRFLRYSQVKIKHCPFNESAVKPLKRTRRPLTAGGMRLEAIADIFATEPAEPPYAPDIDDDDDEEEDHS